MNTSLVIRSVDSQSEDALALLHQAAVEARAMYPALFTHESVWPTNVPTPVGGIYLIGYVDGEPMVSGALRPIDEQTVEVCRMYVMRKARRSGFGSVMLAALEEQAHKIGYKIMRLETGNRQEAAMAMYEAYGFKRIAPFGEYESDPTSVCYEKIIEPRHKA